MEVSSHFGYCNRAGFRARICVTVGHKSIELAAVAPHCALGIRGRRTCSTCCSRLCCNV